MDSTKKAFTKHLKRLYKGRIADARDYEVENCRKAGINIRFVVDGLGEQTFSPDDGVLMSDRKIESQYGTKPYRLVSFYWKVNADQLELAL